MNETRDPTGGLGAGEIEGLGLGEIHLAISTRSPGEAAREIFRTVTLVAPSEIAIDKPFPHGALLTLLRAAQTAIQDDREAE